MNPILDTDSYKLTHWKMYPPGLDFMQSYLEARLGSTGPQQVVWFGLQHCLQNLCLPILAEDVDEAEEFCNHHFGPTGQFNRAGWDLILDEYNGYLPLEIKAIPEGSVVPRGTPLMTIENLDARLPWLTNWAETQLMQVWYPTTVASVSYMIRKQLASMVGADFPGLDFMLHDFGYRGVSSQESAGIGGAAHLLSFKGTDTLAAIDVARWYGWESGDRPAWPAAFSVAASEHSVMTQLGQQGEEQIIEQLIRNHPNQILSIVIDSYDPYQFVEKLKKFVQMAHDQGTKIVIRPDSVTEQHPSVEGQIRWLLDNIPQEWNILWGDGLSSSDILDIAYAIRVSHGKDAARRLVFGMGGGLLQKVNRDTMRFALKACAVKTDGSTEWTPIAKHTIDPGKRSKSGPQDTGMSVVYTNGEMINQQTFGQIRERIWGV